MNPPLIVGHPERPVLYMGLDIGIRRDSTGLVALYQDPRDQSYVLYDHKLWTPSKKREVIIGEVVEAILIAFDHHNIAGLWYDPSQFISEAQRLSQEGFGHLLFEVKQSFEHLVPMCSGIIDGIEAKSLVFYPDEDLRNHFKHASIKMTDRGAYIKKTKTSRPIDLVVAFSMALYGLKRSHIAVTRPSYMEHRHSKSIQVA
tara:strand:- start:990 stop:1592 length:603 start_codon:yes stop_codon:yes gene_type:complete